MLKYINLFLLVVILQLLSCQNKGDNCINCNKKPIKKVAVSNAELEMYSPSELATLMLSMYSINENWKTKINNGIIPNDVPQEYMSIHSLESVNENVKSEFFEDMASSFLESTAKVIESNPKNVKDNYNNMINVCISCHQQICQGPIPKIKKLLIH